MFELTVNLIDFIKTLNYTKIINYIKTHNESKYVLNLDVKTNLILF